MGHFTAPLLQPRVVADLTGLSPASLRRWDAALLPGAARRPRRYSWEEVEILQRAVHQASGRGGSPAAFRGFRGLDRDGDRNGTRSRPRPRTDPARHPRAGAPETDGTRSRPRPRTDPARHPRAGAPETDGTRSRPRPRTDPARHPRAGAPETDDTGRRKAPAGASAGRAKQGSSSRGRRSRRTIVPVGLPRSARRRESGARH
jgi:hypothetical protein